MWSLLSFQRLSGKCEKLEEKLGTLLAYRRHLAEQYQDRTLLWMLQESSLDSMSDVVVMQLDGMDQGKFRLPRDPRLRSTASLRPDFIHLTIVIWFGECFNAGVPQSPNFQINVCWGIHEHLFLEAYHFSFSYFFRSLPKWILKQILATWFKPIASRSSLLRPKLKIHGLWAFGSSVHDCATTFIWTFLFPTVS